MLNYSVLYTTLLFRIHTKLRYQKFKNITSHYPKGSFRRKVAYKYQCLCMLLLYTIFGNNTSWTYKIILS